MVASRGRPAALSLCLTALEQLQYHPYEIVVVADPVGCQAARAHPLGPNLKVEEFDEANLARARNIGIAASGGEIVAFIDDDAFAEPGWLAHLAGAFSLPGVAGAGGYVIGRNGLSLQWAARRVSAEGWHNPISVAGDTPFVPTSQDGTAVRTEGTNMAFRREALAALGGFDESFRYFLEETELNMRMARAGLSVAVVPQARVWHRQDASPRRGADRAPRDLFEIGASTTAFLQRHASAGGRAKAIEAHRRVERRRLLRHMVNGALLPGAVGELIKGFDAGASEGSDRPSKLAQNLEIKPMFRPVRDAPLVRRICQIWGWPWYARRLNTEVRNALAEGALVHLIRLSPTALYHRRTFADPGIWLQYGGLFGRSDRNTPLIRAVGLERRADTEFAKGPMSRVVSFERQC